MISVIVCSADPDKSRRISEHYACLVGAALEMILVNDARSLAEGYNRGSARSHGEVLIFSHDDIEILTTELVPRLHKHLEAYDMIGVAGTTRLLNGSWPSAGPPDIFGQIAHVRPDRPGYVVWIYGNPGRVVGNIQGLDGLFLACRRRVIQSLRFDEQTFDGFHCSDADFTFAAYLAGFRLGVCTDIPIFHASRGTYDERWQQAMARFAHKYQGRLAPAHGRRFQFAAVEARTKAEIVEVMSGPQLS